MWLNKDQKNHSDIKRKMASKMFSYKHFSENSKFGEFIIQTNEVQFMLALAIFKCPFLIDDIREELFEKNGLGTLINKFKKCTKKRSDIEKLLFSDLTKYNTKRNKLAHKMYSSEKLTSKECARAIQDGEMVLKTLYSITDSQRR